jgi:hypothetical protein
MAAAVHQQQLCYADDAFKEWLLQLLAEEFG